MSMNLNIESSIHLISPTDVLSTLREWVKLSRQRLGLTQEELSKKSNVPATTISRLERTGLASTDSLSRVLFALDQLDSFHEFLKARLRFASFPKTLEDEVSNKKILRVRHKRGNEK